MANEFDVNKYLDLRIAADSKLLDITASAVTKGNELRALQTQADAQKVARDKTLSGRIGLDEGGFADSAVNNVASFISGATRDIGNVIGSVVDNKSLNSLNRLNQEQLDAASRFKQNIATAEDIKTLNKKVDTQPTLGIELNTNRPTAFEALQEAEAARSTGRDIRKATNFTGVVDQTKRNELNKSLDDSAAPQAFKDIKEGYKNNEVMKVISGVADLFTSAGGAVLNNKAAVLEYVFENAPQILTGLAGKAGVGLLTASNVGYALDKYQEGIQEYIKTHDGELPSTAELREMSLRSASLMLAEQGSDLLGLGAAKALGKSTGKGIIGGTVNTAKAGGVGIISEAPTEGYQRYQEGEILGKPATAMDIFKDTVIGGAAGGGLVGGMRAVAEATQSTPEHITEKASLLEQVARQKEAIKTGDVSDMTDHTKPNYSPTKAIAALFGNSQLDTTTPEAKQANLKQAEDIVDSLQARRDVAAAALFTPEQKLASINALKAERDAIDPADTNSINIYNTAIATEEKSLNTPPLSLKEIKIQNDLISKLDEELKSTRTVKSELENLITGKEDVDALINQTKASTSTPVDSTQPVSDAIDKIITLSIKSPERFSSQQAKDLAEDTTNTLTPEQRNYFKVFSEARIAENQLQDLGGTSSDIFNGSKPGAKIQFVGIAQYRKRITDALAKGNTVEVTKQLHALANFSKRHTSKAVAAETAIKQGLGVQIAPSKATGLFEVLTTPLSKKNLSSIGGLTINTAKLPNSIRQEANALNLAVNELQALTKLSTKSKVKKPNVNRNDTTTTDTTTSNSTVDNSNDSVSKVNVEERSRDSEPTPTPVPSATTTNRQDVTEVEPEVKKEVSTTIVKENNVKATETKQDKQEEKTTKATDTKTTKDVEEVRTSEPKSTEPVIETYPDGDGKLSVFNKKSTEDLPFKKRNLIADFLTQVKSRDGDSTVRPLVVVKDFLSKLSPTLLKEFSGLVVSSKQTEYVKLFKSLALNIYKPDESWFKQITLNLPEKGDSDYYYLNSIQFLINENRDVEENVKTAIAYAAMQYISETASRGSINTPEQINAILHRDKDTEIDSNTYQALGKIGTSHAIVINSMGKSVIQALGLKALVNAPADVLPRLETVLGGHVFKLLHDKGIIELNSITEAQLLILTNKEVSDNSKNIEHQFIKLKRNAKDELTPVAETIFEASKNTGEILSKLFSVETSIKEPSFEPITKIKPLAKNTNQQVPSKAKEVIKKENAIASYVKPNLWKLVSKLSKDTLMAISGAEHLESAQASIRPNIEAKNNSLEKDIDSFINFVNGMGDINTPMYFDRSMVTSQRIHIDPTIINPQASKFHRYMMYMGSWDTEVNINDTTLMNDFFSAVGMSFGVNPNNLLPADMLAESMNIIESLPIVKAVNTITQVLNGEAITPAMEQLILDGVNAGDENNHSLDGLMALAQYQLAIENGKGSFNTTLMSEVDGVANGVMLSNLLYGAANSVEEMLSLLNRGGFFEVGSSYTQYNQWRSEAGNLDVYENTASNINENILNNLDQLSDKDKLVTATIYTFSDPLESKDIGVVTKTERKTVKSLLTPIHFGSSVKRSIESMSETLITDITKTIKKTYENNSDPKPLVRNINILIKASGGPLINPQLSMNELMEYELSPAQVESIKTSFINTVGKVVQPVIEQDFGTFINKRNDFNQTVDLAYQLYDAAYRGLYDQMINEQMDAYTKDNTKGIEFSLVTNPQTKVKVRKPIHALTIEQVKQIEDQLKDIYPVMGTGFSKASNDLDSGIALIDRESEIDQSNKSEIKFGTPIANKFKNGKPQKSINVGSVKTQNTSPGVSGVSASTHSADSFIMFSSIGDSEILAMHDAKGVGLNNIKDAALSLNESTWNTMLNNSPTSEVANTLQRSIAGLVKLLNNTKNNEAIITNINKMLEVKAKRYAKDLPFNKLIQVVFSDAQYAAYSADQIRLGTLSQLAIIDQYSAEGGAYQVTDADRLEANTRLLALDSETSPEDQALIDTLESLLTKSTPTVTKVVTEVQPVLEKEIPIKVTSSPFGALGKSYNDNNPVLVDFFKTKPERTAKEVIDFLTERFNQKTDTINPEFGIELLKMLTKSVHPDLLIKLIVPTTKLEETIGQPSVNAMGWYSAHKGKEAIYLLSPEFMGSGLTAETLLHELVHAAVAIKIRDGSAEVAPHVQALEELLEKARKYAKSKKITQYEDALSNVDEMISYGLTNQGFQEDILAKLRMGPQTKPVSGLQLFIDKITDILFGSFAKKPQINSGMAALIQHVTHVMALSSKGKNQLGNGINLAMVSPVTSNYTTTDIYNSLSTNQVTLTPEFNNHLKDLLTGIVHKLHGTYGSLKKSLMTNQTMTPVDVWLNALNTGVAPFASQIINSGLTISDKELFVIEQVEATVKAAVDMNEAQTKVAYRQLSDLYIEAYQRIKPEHFYKGPDWNTATPTEKASAQAIHDFIFKIEKNNGDRSNYLARFAALGLAHQDFNKLLRIPSKIILTSFKDQKTIFDKLQYIFNNILSMFQNSVVYDGQNINARLEALVSKLVEIEAKRKYELELRAIAQPGVTEKLETTLQGVATTIQTKASAAANSQFITNNSSGIIRGLGGIVGVVADQRIGAFMDEVSHLRNQHFKERLGVVAGIADAIRGPVEQFKSMLLAVKNNERIRKEIITNASKSALQTFINAGKDLNSDTKSSITRVLLRTGSHVLLDHMNLSRLENILGNQTELNKEIDKLETKLDGFKLQHKAYFIAQANALAYNKATGKNHSVLLMQNSYNIARLNGTPQKGNISEANSATAQPIIEALIALYALGYADTASIANVKSTLRIENSRTDGNGIEFVLGLHKQLESESKARLFRGNPALMVHGFTPDILDPYTDIQVANEAVGRDLIARGFIQNVKVPTIDGEIKHIYVLQGGGLQPLVSGIMSYDSKTAKGTTVDKAKITPAVMNGINNRINDLFKVRPRFDLSKTDESNIAPLLNEKGDVVDWRYLMNDSTKDTLLKRNNQFNDLLGSLAGSIYSKETVSENNTRGIQALYDDYNDGYKLNPDSYVLVGPRSSDSEMRDIWNRLPSDTKKDIVNIWDREGMMVRRDLLDITFGYRKESLSKLFNIDIGNSDFNPIERIMSEFFIGFMQHMFKDKAELKVIKAERIWQELVHEAKDIIVVKSGLVTLMNTISNQSLLYIKGVGIKDIVHHQLVALKGADAYKKDSTELRKLQTLLDTGHTQNKVQQIKRDITRLEDAIARNPVTKLINEGMMPTIVEDISVDQDMYTNRSTLVNQLKNATSSFNPDLVNLAKKVYMPKDSEWYIAFSRAAQLSDFIGKYALYQHLISRKKNPLTHEQAILEASDTFIDYNIPMHRRIQYLDDTGLLMFTKYFLRIQRVLFQAKFEKPLRFLTLLGITQYIDLGETILDSSFTNHIGSNPLDEGPLKLLTSIDDLATVNAASTVIQGLIPDTPTK